MHHPTLPHPSQPCSEAELHNMIQEADPSGEGKLNFDAFKHVVEQCV